MISREAKYLLARVNMPIRESLDAFAGRLDRLMRGFMFEEETSGRFEEVPAFVAEKGGVEFVLFGVPEGEPDTETYVLEFRCKTEQSIEAFLASDAGGFLRQFVRDKPAKDGMFLDYSEELAAVLVQSGIEGCKSIRPVQS